MQTSIIKRIAALIFSVFSLLFFAVPAFASDFTVSNVDYDVSTHRLNFDYSLSGSPIQALDGSISTYKLDSAHLYNSTSTYDATTQVIYYYDGGYQLSGCTSTHCSFVDGQTSGTSGWSDSNYISSANYNIVLYTGLRSGSCCTAYYSNTFTLPSSPSAQIVVTPSSGAQTVGVPFNVDVKVTSNASAFNAAKAQFSFTNLSVTGIHSPSSNACNFQYTQQPTTSDPSFQGAMYNSSTTDCTVYTLTLTPTSTGTGTITLSNGSVVSFETNNPISTTLQNGSYTINAGPTPTPTTSPDQLTVTSLLDTYYLSSPYTLAGNTNNSLITDVFIKQGTGSYSDSGVTVSGTNWSAPETLVTPAPSTVPADNTFSFYGTDASNNQTASSTVDVKVHNLADINGDGVVDLTDASLFAVDYGKTSNLTYNLSDMNGDGSADLTDLSILAKHEQ